MKEHLIQPLHVATFSNILVATGASLSSEAEYPYFHTVYLVYKIMKRVRTCVPAGRPTDSLEVQVSR